MSMKLRCSTLTLAAFLMLPAAMADMPPAADWAPRGGLVVCVGIDAQCGGQALADLHAETGCVVHALSADADLVARLREELRALGASGRVSVDAFDGRRLPYVNRLANAAVVAAGAEAALRGEVERVLAPGGVIVSAPELAWEGRALEGGWRLWEKPAPADTDAWPQYLHGPGNNAVGHDALVGPPKRLQWTAGPVWTRNHHKLNSLSAAVTGGRRLFYIVDEATAANMAVPGKWALVARDAYNGMLLWKKPLASWAWHALGFRSGPPQVSRLLVTDGAQVYAPLGLSAPVSKIDAATGETLETYTPTEGAEEIVLVDGVLLVLTGAPVAEQAHRHPDFEDAFAFPNRKAVVALDLGTGKTRWTWTADRGLPRPETLASDGARAYIQAADGVAALDMTTGAPAWTYGDTEKAEAHDLTFGKYTLVAANGVVLCNLPGGVTALDAQTGALLWQREAARHGFHEPLDIFVINGLVWLGTNRPDSVAPPAADDFNQGLDLRTGAVKRELPVMAELQTAGHHHRCYRERATTRFIMTGKRGIEMMDLEGANHFRANWVRGSCQFGFIPANGLVYAPPHSCGCYMESMLSGFCALAAAQSSLDVSQRMIPDDARLERGPAYAKTEATAPAGPEAWPHYRHDALRSGVASTELDAALRPAWRVELGGRLTQPVAAEGVVVVAQTDAHTVVALDADSGARRWTFTCGGRIDSPPALYQGRVLFGSADGCVYCLRFEDGALAWRFMAAPADIRAAAFEQVESLWPVHGSVLVLDGVAYASAGRSTWLDGGIRLYALNPLTGEVLDAHRFRSRDPQFEEGKVRAKPEYDERFDQNVSDYKTYLQPDRSDSFSMAGGAISDVLVSDGADVFLHQARFSAALEPQPVMARHLFSTSSLLDDAENHRSHWVLGTGDFSRVPVAYSWIVNSRGARRRGTGLAAPYGVLLAFDGQGVWGAHRNGEADGKYTVFQREHTSLLESAKGLPDFRPLGNDEQPFPYVWRRGLDERPRALIKAGGKLILATTPTVIPQDDPHAAYEGRLGGRIAILDAASGDVLAAHALDAPVAWDGLAAAHGRLYAAQENGVLLCLGS